jgi:hypothetical protein
MDKLIKLLLFPSVIGLKGGSLILEKDYGVDLLSKPPRDTRYFIQVIQDIVKFLNKLVNNSNNLICVFYPLEHINQDNF